MLPRVLHAILDAIAVFAPVDCAGCGGPDRGLCEACRFLLQPDVTPRALAGGDIVFTALRYEASVRHAILAFKEQGRTDLARPLAVPFGAAIARALATGGVALAPEVMAVPTSRSAWRRRGYDPVALLCRRAGISLARELVHTRRTANQKSVAGSDRAANLAGSLLAPQSLQGRRFVLVDDVLTTGATFREAARAVRAAGGDVVCGAALAFTPRLFAASESSY